jgi:hypothetical protein
MSRSAQLSVVADETMNDEEKARSLVADAIRRMTDEGMRYVAEVRGQVAAARVPPSQQEKNG